jgi:cell division protein FtsZ
MEGFNTSGFSIDFDLPKGNSSIIKVIGVGGGGNNALRYMYEKGIHGVDFVVCNTDAQALDNSPVSNKVQLGISITEGLGAGADPEVGEKSAIESIEEIKTTLGQNTKMIFITAGLGGGTGTGAAPVIAKVAKEMGILTVAIVTVPFSFEGKRRLEQAESGLEKLRDNVDSLIVINNDKLRQQFGNLGFKQGFAKADEVLTNAAKGMAEVITGYFTVNIDFRDAKSVLANSGTALMSTGIATGENKAEDAVKKALDSPLLNDNKITGAKNVLLLIRSGNNEATMDEIGLINDHIQKEAGNTADIIFGVGTDEELGDAISVLVIATGFDNRINSGTVEKIKFNLNDPVEKRESSFKKYKDKSETNRQNFERQNSLKLEDENNAEIFHFQENTDVEKNRLEEEEAQTQVLFFEKSEEVHDNSADFNKEEETLESGLFSYEEDAAHLETQSFNFETEESAKTLEAETKIEDIPLEEKPKNNTDFSEEKPIEISFFINDSVENHTDLKENKIESAEEQTQPKFTLEKPVVAETFDVQREKILEKKPINESEEKWATASESGFTLIDKPPLHEQKIQERRNKLKEFNSHYQVSEEESDFETVPAFRRKNISIGTQNDL